jgi:ATP sulfurylase
MVVKIVYLCPGCTHLIIGKCKATVCLELKTFLQEKYFGTYNKRDIKYDDFYNSFTTKFYVVNLSEQRAL